MHLSHGLSNWAPLHPQVSSTCLTATGKLALRYDFQSDIELYLDPV